MKNNSYFFTSSIGKKIIMAVTGFLLFGFLIIHLLGNLLLYVGKNSYNLYANALTSNKIFLYTIEIFLLLFFAIHIIDGIIITILNRKARNQSYKVTKKRRTASWASSNMIVTGSIIFIFIILHLSTFKYGETLNYNINGQEIRDLHTIVVQQFSSEWFYMPLYAIFYIIAMALMGFHIRHGIQSIFKTFGVYHNRYTPIIDKLALLLALFFSLSYMSFPIYFGFIL